MRYFLTMIGVIASSISLGQAVPKLQISELAKDFYVYVTYGDAGNGQMYPANGMYMVTKQGVVMFDTPWDSTQFQPLLDTITARHGKKVVMAFATHFHEDRTLGLAYYQKAGIKTYTTKMTDDLSVRRNKPRAEYMMQKDTVFKVGQYEFEVYYPGAGHSPDNIVIWVGQAKILYGGCFIKSTDTNSPGNLSDANVEEWVRSIERVESRFKDPAHVIPGHEGWTNRSALQHTARILENYRRSPKQK